MLSLVQKQKKKLHFDPLGQLPPHTDNYWDRTQRSSASRKQKQGFFASRKQFRDFSAKRFCFIHTIFLLQRTVFCCIGTFIEAKAGLRKSGGTRGSTRGRRIARSDPSEDAQSLS
jgi:hypothetical protein